MSQAVSTKRQRRVSFAPMDVYHQPTTTAANLPETAWSSEQIHPRANRTDNSNDSGGYKDENDENDENDSEEVVVEEGDTTAGLLPFAPATPLTVQEAVNFVGEGRFQLYLLFTTGATQLADAMELMLLPFLINGVRCDSEWAATVTESSLAFLSSIVFVGMLLGAYAGGVLSDSMGRRFGFLLSTACCTVGGVLSALAPNFLALVVSRLVVGCGVGGSSAALSLFTEFIPASSDRARKLVVFLSFFSLGTVLEACLAGLIMPAYGWRALLWASVVPSLMLLTAVLAFPALLPESPRLLLASAAASPHAQAHPDYRRAKTVLEDAARINGRAFPSNWVLSVHAADLGAGDMEESSMEGAVSVTFIASNGKSSSVSAHTPPTLFQQALRREQPVADVKLGWRALWADRKLRNLTALLGCIYFLMALLYYSLVVLSVSLSLAPTSQGHANGTHRHEVSSSSLRDAACSVNFVSIVLINAGEIPGLVLALWLLNKIGRRKTVAALFLACGCFICILFVPGIPSLLDGLVFTLVMLVIRMTALGFNQSLWIYSTELLPTRVRATGLGAASACARIGGIMSPFISQILMQDSSTATFTVCVSTSVLAALLVLRVPMETHQRQIF